MTRRFITIVLCLSFISACIHQTQAVSGDLTTFHSGSLKIPPKNNVPMKIFVDAPGNGDIAHNLSQQLNRNRFRLVDAPSKAGYILHVTVLHQGEVNPESLKSCVKKGYGNEVRVSGKGAYGIVADALMVQRRVPEATKTGRQKLKNISSRNALESAQMRLGTLGDHAPSENEKRDFAMAIARQLAKSITE